MEYTELTDDQLATLEQELSAEIQALDDQIIALREQMRAQDRQVNPIRNEIENRKFRRARRDPRSQGVGFNPVTQVPYIEDDNTNG